MRGLMSDLESKINKFLFVCQCLVGGWFSVIVLWVKLFISFKSPEYE